MFFTCTTRIALTRD